MSETKHTPGPWKWIPAVGTELGRIVAGVDDHYSVVCGFGDCEQYYPIEGTEPNEFDRALMLAAPDLLAACKMVAAMAVPQEPLSVGDIAEVLAAIAKAEGRS